MKFTLRYLFIAVAMLALACAGLTYRNLWWASGIFNATVLLFVVVALSTAGRRLHGRSSSLAFAVVGGGYLLLTLCSGFTPARDLLLTNQAIVVVGKRLTLSPPQILATWRTAAGVPTQYLGDADELDKNVPPGATNLKVSPHGSNGWDGVEFGSQKSLNPLIPEQAFLIIGHCVFSWIFAVLAAWFAGRMYDRRERTTKEAI